MSGSVERKSRGELSVSEFLLVLGCSAKRRSRRYLVGFSELAEEIRETVGEAVEKNRLVLSRIASIAAAILFIVSFVAAYRGAQDHYYARQSELAIRALVETSPTAVITLDKEGKITDWPGPAVRLFGYTASEMLGQTPACLMPEEMREFHQHGFAAVMADPEKWKHILRIRCTAVSKSGKQREVIVTTRIVPGKDGPMAVATIDKASLVREVD